MTEQTRSPDFLAGGGELGALLRATDWSRTPLGPPDSWSRSLTTLVRVILTSRQPMFVWWGEELINLYNDPYRAILGGKHPQALGQPASVVWREIWDQVGPRAAQALSGNEGTYDEALLLIMERHSYPEETYYTFSYSPVSGDDGGIGGILCANTDDTQRIIGERQVALLRDLAARTAEARTATEACRLAAAALQTASRDLPFALLYLTDADHRNPVFAASAGLSPSWDTERLREISNWPMEPVLRTGVAEFISDLDARLAPLPRGAWDRPPSSAIVLPIAAQGQSGCAGLLVVGLNPYRRYEDSYRGFLSLVAGTIAAALANAQAYEQERRRAEAFAEIDRAKTAFFSNASHEFRTPLTLMLGPLENLLVQSATQDTVLAERGELELMHRNGLRLLKLVNTLLDFSRIEAGRIQASYDPVDLAAFTAELASSFRSAMDRAGLCFTVDCPPLPATAYVDRDMWEKIVLNLLSNAIKYTLDGGVTVRLQAVDDGTIALTVEDTGVGIPDSELPHVFERFHRIEGQRGRTHEGTGIGLALVQELARLHGGRVDAESAVGQGTHFRVTIPSGRDHLPRDQIQAARHQPSTGLRADAFVEEAMRWLAGPADEPAIQRELLEPGPMPARGGDRARVLLADDNADMRHYVQRLLAPRYAVQAVADGGAALEAARRQPPDLVLTDIMMPRLDGFGLLRALRADPDLRDIPVVLLSARAGEGARVEGLEAGADDYLTKPFGARELVARVDTNLGLAKARREVARQERALRAEAEMMRRRFEAVVQNLPFAIIMVDATGRMLLGNPAMARILGQSPQSIESIADFVRFRAQHPDGRLYDAREYPVARALAGEVVQNHEMTCLIGDGEQRWFRVSAIPVRNASRTVVSAISVAVDVDSEKRAELALRQLNETLESRVTAEISERTKAEEALRQAHKMEAIGQLTGGVAHDFNNLLQIVMGNLESLQRRVSGGKATSADLLRLAQNALNGAQRAAVLTHRLLAFSRRQPLQPSALDANALVGGMAELLRRTLGEAVMLESVQAGGLWPVYADLHQLENALLNLAVNARDAMPNGGKLTIEAANVFLDEAYAAQEQVDAGQYVMLAVSDTGTGMSRDVIARAFDPFFTTKEVGQGTGLGLSQVYGFAKQSGGHAKIYSESGQGTTVKLYLPRRHGAEPARSQPRQPAVVAGHAETILVVEDEADVRAHTVATLRELGYRVLEAADGADALARLERHPETRLLFTDVGLPGGMNGRQLADEARRRRPGLPVLFTTGYARNAIVHQGRLDPDVALLPKPFTFGGLAAKLREMLEMAADVTSG